MNPGADFDPPAGDPRFGNGVPAHLKPRGLAFIEMTGVSRPGISGVAVPLQADYAAAEPKILPLEGGPAVPRAAALFEDLLHTLQGQVKAPEPSARPVERPAGAAQTLAEVESLFQALDRP